MSVTVPRRPETSRPPRIRRLWRSDMAAFCAHLLRLDPDSRHLRFGAAVSDAFLQQYASYCFGRGDLVFGAFLDDVLMGAAELRSTQAIWAEQPPLGRHIHAEAAFSVEAACRRRGVGEALFRRLLEAAGNHGVETIEIVCLPHNTAMQKLAAKFSTDFKFDQQQLLGTLTARRPTPFSLWSEAASDVVDFGGALLDAQRRALSL